MADMNKKAAKGKEREWIGTARVTKLVEVMVTACSREEADGKVEAGDFEDLRDLDLEDRGLIGSMEENR